MKKLMIITAFAIILAACSPKGGVLTIEPYKFNEKESQLIERTGFFSVDYFTMNGNLDNADLQFTVEVYENGKLKEELISMHGMMETSFKKDLLSFSLFETENEQEHQQFTLHIGTPSGSLASSTYDTKAPMMASVYGALINDKITLEKDQPIYIAGWAGTMKDVVPTLHGENGQLPGNLESYEQALLLKVLWTDGEK